MNPFMNDIGFRVCHLKNPQGLVQPILPNAKKVTFGPAQFWSAPSHWSFGYARETL